MSTESVAVELLRCALSHDAGARLVGNITAREIAAVASKQITRCPQCGSEPWVGIDCWLCLVCADLEPPPDEN